MSVVMRAHCERSELVPLQVGPGLGGRDAGLVAQLVERCPCTAEATGSNPVESKAGFVRLVRDMCAIASQ